MVSTLPWPDRLKPLWWMVRRRRGRRSKTQGTDTFGPFFWPFWPHNDTVAVCKVSLKQGQTMLCGTFLDDQGKEICGAYYVSVRYLANGP